jgi:hypothetical protein
LVLSSCQCYKSTVQKERIWQAPLAFLPTPGPLTLLASRTSRCSLYRMCRIQRTSSMGQRSYVF